MDERIAYIKRAMERYKGDDLERCLHYFHGYSKDEMQVMHGVSGKTRQSILDGYREERELWFRSMALIEKVFPEMKL